MWATMWVIGVRVYWSGTCSSPQAPRRDAHELREPRSSRLPQGPAHGLPAHPHALQARGGEGPRLAHEPHAAQARLRGRKLRAARGAPGPLRSAQRAVRD